MLILFNSRDPQIRRVQAAAERARRWLLAWVGFKGSSLSARVFADVQQRQLTNLCEHVRQRKQISKQLISVSVGCSVQTSQVVSKAGTVVFPPLMSAAPSQCRQPGWTVDRLCSSEPFTSFSGPSLKTAAFKALPASTEEPACKSSNLFFGRKR